jgi:ubiquinone/menaquinone biosynthesis C-methylase UbiE
MRAFESNQFFFICLNDDISRLTTSHNEPSNPPIFDNTIISIWKISCSEVEFLKRIEKNCELELIRYFDCFYLLIPSIQKDIKKIYEEFFNFISFDYENFIDTKRNLENIRNLLKIASAHTNFTDELKILDYGCGTGLSFDLGKEFNCMIFGFDVCPNMRILASKKGLIVWDEKQFATQSENTIDCVISSYVFHFLIDDTYLKILYKILKPRGILVANFHKNKNREFIDHALKKIGFKILKSEEIKDNEYHGTYVVYNKR